MCEWIVKEGQTIAQVKQEMLAHITKIDPKYQHLTPENCWIRKKGYKNPTKVCLDEHILGEDIYLTGTDIQVKIPVIFLTKNIL